MTGTIFDRFDQCFRFTEDIQDFPGYLEVGPFIIGADVVDFSRDSIPEDDVDGGAVVGHEEPVPDVGAVAVEGQGEIIEGVGDEEGDQFFRVLIGAEIVGGPGYDDR